jgi:hypothetical protein
MTEQPFPSDALIPVAYAIHSSPKRYALLLGAGISISAGLPTGPEASGSMIRKIAQGRGETIEEGHNLSACLTWFERIFEASATFDLLMEKLGISEANRRDGLLPFIIPLDGNGHAISIAPTPAHRAIAELVKEGLVSTIITTNFDHLLEDAIKNATGIPPLVITSDTDPSLMSVFPDRCRVVKVNGDFSIKKLKITPEDLKLYDSAMKDYIRRIGSEYGLIICGWSGEFDLGLVEILAALEVRRYPTFWALRPDGEIPMGLNTALKPCPIQIESADGFFTGTHTVVNRLQVVERDQPLSIQVAIRKVTDALQQPRPEIVLRELLQKETDLVLDELAKDDYLPLGDVNIPLVFQSRVLALERKTAPLAAMLSTIAYYDDSQYCDLVYDVIERLINIQYISPFHEGARRFIGFPYSVNRFNDCLFNLRLLPALLSIYSAGIAATKAFHLNMLDAILEPKMRMAGSFTLVNEPYMQFVNPRVILGGSDLCVNLNQTLFGISGDIFLYPYNTAYRILNHLIPNRDRFSQMYDVFEYFFGLAFLKEKKGDISLDSLNKGLLPTLDSRLCSVTYHRVPPGKMIVPQHVTEYSDRIKNFAPTRRLSGPVPFFCQYGDYRNCEESWEILFGLREPPTPPKKRMDDLDPM